MVEKYLEAEDGLREFPKERKIPEKRSESFILFPFELNAKQAESLEIKEAESLELIKNHLTSFKRVFVPTSHGKDSIVMVHLVVRACKELDIPLPDFWLNHTLNVYKEEADYWTLINDFLGIKDQFKIFYPGKDEDTGKTWTVWSIAEKFKHLPDFRATAKKGVHYKKGGTPECCDILKKDHINEHLKSLPEEERYDCHFIGTRAEESFIRRLGVLQRCRTYVTKYRKPYPIRTVTPIAFWKEKDVWDYFAKYQIPVNPAYSVHNQPRLGCASCPAHKGWEARLAGDPTNEGFGMLKQNFKILWETDKPRLEQSLDDLTKWLKGKKSKDVQGHARDRVIDLVIQFNKQLGRDVNARLD